MKTTDDFKVTITLDGRITFEMAPGVEVPDYIMNIAQTMAGDDVPIAVAGCQPMEVIEARAQRLAALLLGRACSRG